MECCRRNDDRRWTLGKRLCHDRHWKMALGATTTAAAHWHVDLPIIMVFTVAADPYLPLSESIGVPFIPAIRKQWSFIEI
ncbi:MAG: hypothetical protein R3C56_32855 [Pirellulaceae bacterium]